ncbi:WD domain, G-beta repeat protein [Aphelenchoides bicaudatus]|nr:WD domain, G-beta repeat protein [Aphelenchoides bicaudatus]
MTEQDRRTLALEEKRQRLAEIRMERQRNNEARNSIAPRMTISGDTRPRQNGTISASHSTRDMEALLGPLGIPAPSVAPQTLPLQRNGSANFQMSNGSLNNFAVSDGSSDSNLSSSRVRPAQLEVVTLNPVTIAPKNDNRYAKATQTIEAETHMDGFSTGSRDEFEFDELSISEKGAHAEDLFDDTSPSHALARILGRPLHEPQHSEEEKVTVQPSKPPELTQEQRDKIMNNETLQRFLTKSARWIERAIAVEKDKDIFADYSSDRKDNTYTDALLTPSGRFNDGQYLNEQSGLAIDFSDSHSELLAVAVNGKPNSDGPEGIINVWNTNFGTSSPECVFHSNSSLKSMCFAKFSPKLVIGGCSSGQLCVWDLRSNRRNPVNKSSINSRTHTQGIMRMQMVGTQHTHELVTVSLDGVVCWWSLDNLHTPIEKFNALSGPKKNLPISTISFEHNDVSKFVCGGEDGTLYLGDRSEVSEEKKIYADINAHQGAITNAELHKAPGSTDFSRYCLTSSMDFTCKLWNLADCKKDSKKEDIKPIFSFDSKHGGYVSHIAWSPVHPSTFISSSLAGTLNLWNLNSDVEDPLAVQRAGKSIYQTAWANNGRQIAALDESGIVQLYDVHESLHNVKPTEWETFAGVCREAVNTGINSV